jgi:hypothetical protein
VLLHAHDWLSALGYFLYQDNNDSLVYESTE